MRRLATVVSFAALLAVISGFSASLASATCDTNYWTVGCQFYSQNEGHTRTQLGASGFNTTHYTFDTNTNSKMIWTTAGGTWSGADLLPSGTWDHWHTGNSDDKFGCYNPNAATEWVNCREYQGWGET
jgi:hypothetical protein